MSKRTTVILGPEIERRVEDLQEALGRATQSEVIREALEVGLEVMTQAEELRELVIVRKTRERAEDTDIARSSMARAADGTLVFKEEK